MSARTASAVVALIGSAMAITPLALPSSAAKIAVAPSLRDSSASPSSAPTSIPAACIMSWLPSATLRPSMIPVTPLPETLSKPSTLASARLRSAAARTIAAARGCSLPRSRLAASLSSSSSLTPGAGLSATTLGLPSVNVPVLSATSVSTFSSRSSASAFLIRTPACAPRPTPTMIDIGVAKPNAHGQAMISTETAATRP